MMGVRLLRLFLVFGLLVFGDRPGNFTIRFEPTAMLQTGARIPFQITVADDRKKPVGEAKVTLEIEQTNRQNIQVFDAPAIAAGVYLAKPVFPAPGQWKISVEVHRNGEASSRTKDYTVPE
jgi:hypothetical protein